MFQVVLMNSYNNKIALIFSKIATKCIYYVERVSNQIFVVLMLRFIVTVITFLENLSKLNFLYLFKYNLTSLG